MAGKSPPRILIVGCGLGGIALALALRRHGLACTVLEQAPALRTVGAGIQLSANAVRVLKKLGIGPALDRVAVRPRAHVFRQWDTGETILETPLGQTAEAAFGEPYYHAHRADVLAALVDQLGLDHVALGCRVTAAGWDADGVRVTTEAGETIAGDVLIGADGIHSCIRQAMFGQDRPRYAGNIAWRALVPVARIAHMKLEPLSSIWMGPNRSVVHYFVSAGRLMNWIGISRGPENTVESWTQRGAIADALAEWEGWCPELTAMMAATPPEMLFKMALYDREPLPRWTDGRVAILGDAAHPMLPFHAQGAAQSIEDAYVLAGCLAAMPQDVPAALDRYARLRIDRANWVQAFSREMEGMVHMADPVQIARRNSRLKQRQAEYPDGFPPGQIKLYSYDAEAVLAA